MGRSTSVRSKALEINKVARSPVTLSERRKVSVDQKAQIERCPANWDKVLPGMFAGVPSFFASLW